ncbi:FAD-binding oxidoreductase [Streptomonospora nanhaiensis]|uniref:FAD-binding oxidoreductase n=1 Tax=Streptomonospora nanhaiensis TaxID=1323731 RepID=A0ABY6YS32_9ACTN|nr:FAD-binding oxidoreductase [Streptomonospora nanhaiensis]WAE75007.1 FAD-binding oxidoreductase [Streptomonospora nanhaiensis]
MVAWRPATLAADRWETDSARTLVLDVPGWPGHRAGQHVDVRLTAEDGYTAQRGYSVASADEGERIELTVQRVEGGEVSSYLVDVFAPGDAVEVRGPLGGWFVWDAASPDPVVLVGGGSGVVPLMAMVRERRRVGSRALFRVLYSVRMPEDRYYRGELGAHRPGDGGVDLFVAYTRRAPEASPRGPGRLGAAELNTHGFPAEFAPVCFVCGPTGFVETASDALVALGHDPRRVRTERFGSGGGAR